MPFNLSANDTLWRRSIPVPLFELLEVPSTFHWIKGDLLIPTESPAHGTGTGSLLPKLGHSSPMGWHSLSHFFVGGALLATWVTWANTFFAVLFHSKRILTFSNEPSDRLAFSPLVVYLSSPRRASRFTKPSLTYRCWMKRWLNEEKKYRSFAIVCC